MTTPTLHFEADSTLQPLEGNRIIRTYWLAEECSILFHTSDRRFWELHVSKRQQDGSGKRPVIWQVDRGINLQDASYMGSELGCFTHPLDKGVAAIASLKIHTQRGDSVVTAVMDTVTDDNMPEFALSPYIGYPPDSATTLGWVYNCEAKEKPKNDPCLH